MTTREPETKTNAALFQKGAHSQESALTLLNFGTRSLAMKKNEAAILLQLVTRDDAWAKEYARVKYECFQTQLPTTVALPSKFRALSVELTAAFFLLIGMDSLADDKKAMNKLRKVFSPYYQTAQAAVDILESGEYADESVLLMLWREPEQLMMYLIMGHLRLIDCDEDYLAATWELLMEYDITNPHSEFMSELLDGIYSELRQKTEIVGRYKMAGDYQSAWMGHQEEEEKNRDFIFDPVNMARVCAARAGIDTFVGVGASAVITKTNSEIALASIFESLRLKPLKEEDGSPLPSFRHAILRNQDRTEGFLNSYLAMIVISKMSQQLSTDILQYLKAQMYGDAQAQRAMERELRKQSNAADLQAENERLRKRIDELENQRLAAKKREEALKEQIRKLQESPNGMQEPEEDLAENAKEFPSWSAEEALSTEDGFQDIFETSDAEYHNLALQLCSDHKVIIVGGNENLIKRLRGIQPNINYLNEDRIGSCDMAVQNADLILFKVDSMPHTIYQKCKAIAKTCNVPFGYIPETTSVAGIEKVICEAVMDKVVKEESRGA